nr:DUF397 domain-containing protein [Actinomadura sp. WMMA1423]
MIRSHTGVAESHALIWRKSSRSNSFDNAQCVEVAGAETSILVRDSKDVQGAALSMGGSEWAELVTRIKQGQLDL